MWDFLLYAVIPVNEYRNYFGSIAGQNLARRGKLNWILGERRAEQGEAM